MIIFLDDTNCKDNLVPFTHTRHVADIRIGILTIREKWSGLSKLTDDFTVSAEKTEQSIVVPANIIPTMDNYLQLLQAAQMNTLAALSKDLPTIQYPWDIFRLNEWAIQKDFEWITKNRTSQPLNSSNFYLKAEHIFIEPGVKMNHCSLNAEKGPIYIGANAEIMEGSLLRGPISIGENSVVKMGARLYGGTTIGPFCVAAGEIKNSVLFEYSNKAHDGYLGDSVIGAWCNLGAGTTNSNVKNNAGDIYYSKDNLFHSISAGNKAGLLMGDYSRSAINTAFNTGSFVGVSCNVFTAGFPETYIPNFTWGKEKYLLDKALSDIDKWKKMKNKSITPQEIELLTNLYQS
jgi:UDP-N-acetylglucosamine diphosphorylase/glucosamine-1-phosphate N-acetyltransferase